MRTVWHVCFVWAVACFSNFSSLVPRTVPRGREKQAEQARLRDGQHDFDFNFGTWKTRIRRLRHPLTGSSEWRAKGNGGGTKGLGRPGAA